MKTIKADIIEILTDWGSDGHGEFDGMWYGYESLLQEINEPINTLQKAMKELAKENKVELRPTYDHDYKLNGRGWFLVY